MRLSSWCYIRMYPKIKLTSMELVLMPFRLEKEIALICILVFQLFNISIKLAEVTERHPRSSQIVTRSSNFVYTIWAVFGGFILHFLLSNYLNVLLKPSYEKPIDTMMDLIESRMTIYCDPYKPCKSSFENSDNPFKKELSERIVDIKNMTVFYQMVNDTLAKGTSATIDHFPTVWSLDDLDKWYRSSERVSGYHPYVGHLANKKWPLRKVFNQIFIIEF